MVNKKLTHAISSDIPIYVCENITCRLCGCMGNNVSFILLKESNHLVKQIKRETGVQIKDSDKFPKTVCRGCVDKIKLIEHFKAHCLKTQKVFLLEINKNINSSKSQRPITTDSVARYSIAPRKTETSSEVVIWTDESDDELSNTNTMSDSNSNENSTSKYGILYENMATFNNIHVTVKNDEQSQTATVTPQKLLGINTKPRVQTYSKEELVQISEADPVIEMVEIKEEDYDTDYDEITKDEHSEEHDTTENNMFIRLNENETDGTVLYKLLAVNQQVGNKEPDFILPDEPDHENHIEVIEDSDDAQPTETIIQDVIDIDQNTETNEENMIVEQSNVNEEDGDIEYKFEVSNVENNEQIEYLSESAYENNFTYIEKVDKRGRIFVTNSYKFIKKDSDSSEYICTICNEKFQYPYEAEVHVRKHTGELPFTCKTCGKGFSTGFHLFKHEKTHGTVAIQYICEICGQTFREAFALKHHQRIHTDETPSFKCEKCGKDFFTKISYDAHKLTHVEKKHVCTICGKRFALYAMLSRHKIWHKKIKLKCDVCPILSKTREEYTEHRKHHERNLAHKCQTCSLSFYSQKGLQIHESLKHKTPKKTDFVISNVVTENIESVEDTLLVE